MFYVEIFHVILLLEKGLSLVLFFSMQKSVFSCIPTKYFNPNHLMF
jgi:hypothetical protein